MFLEISQNSLENTCARAKAYNFIKNETLAQVFSCKFGKFFMDNYFYTQEWCNCEKFEKMPAS